VHQLHRISIGQIGLVEVRTPDDLSVQLDYDRSGIQAEMVQQI
jgi:hypothetical protein